MTEAISLETLTFATSLQRLGQDLTVKILEDNLRAPAASTDPSTREQAIEALKYIAEGPATVRKISVSAFCAANSSSSNSTVQIAMMDSSKDIFIHCPSGDPGSEETHRAVLVISESAAPERDISVAFFAYFKEFFPLESIGEWLKEVLRTVTGTNTFMLRLINEEFPTVMNALSDLVFVDRIRILDDALSAVSNVRTVHVTLPVRVDNLKHVGYPIIEKIVKYWLGDISIEILEAGSTQSTSVNRRIWGLRWDPFYYSWHIVAVKQGGHFVWHAGEFSKDKDLRGIRELVHTAPISHRQSVVPIIFHVGDTYVLKIHLSFKIFGFLSVPPCTLWFNIHIPSLGELRLQLFDVAGFAGRAARILFPSTVKQIMDYCSLVLRLGDVEGLPGILKEFSTLFTANDNEDGKEGDASEAGSADKDDDLPNSCKSSLLSSSSRRNLPSVFICGHARCKSRSLLTWVVHLIWTKVVESNAIFEIWRLIFVLFSALLADVLKLAKKIPPDVDDKKPDAQKAPA
jgi:hypothetical protein